MHVIRWGYAAAVLGIGGGVVLAWTGDVATGLFASGCGVLVLLSLIYFKRRFANRIADHS